MSIKELKDCYSWMEVARDYSYYSIKHQKEKDLQLTAIKLTEKIPEPSNTKEYYNSYLNRKYTKLVKR